MGWLLLLALASCSRSSPTEPRGGSCPPTFGQPGVCPRDPCTYPEGDCACYTEPTGGGWSGAERREASSDPGDWTCARKRGRSDGCPDDLAAGLACGETHRTCKERETPVCVPVFECSHGTWRETDPCPIP